MADIGHSVTPSLVLAVDTIIDRLDANRREVCVCMYVCVHVYFHALGCFIFESYIPETRGVV